MLDRESRALGKLVESAPSDDEPDQQVMGFEDDFFLFDDPAGLGYGMGLEPGAALLESLGVASGVSGVSGRQGSVGGNVPGA